MFYDSKNVFNNLLPSEIRLNVVNDDTSNWAEIQKGIAKLKRNNEATRRNEALACFHEIYATNLLSASFKCRVLAMMTRLGKRVGHEEVQFTLNIDPYWSEAIALATRMRKTEFIASETLTITLIQKIVQFLQNSRHYLPDQESARVLEQGMASLSDLRDAWSVTGLILLVTCLPSKGIDYDPLLPKWVDIWTSIEHCQEWDACWLTLLCRARKYSRTFPWLSLQPILFTKMRHMLQLPKLAGRIQNVEFPHSFPRYFTCLLGFADAGKTALYKLTKLIYFTSFQGNAVTISPVAISLTKLPQDPATGAEVRVPGLTDPASVRQGTADLAVFLQTVRVYVYPSNAGKWSLLLGFFLSTIVREMSQHVGKALANRVLEGPREGATEGPVRSYTHPVHRDTMLYLGGALIPFVLEMLYGRNPVLCQTAASTLLQLVSVDPQLGRIIVPYLLAALDPEAVTQSHQAPAAIHALLYLTKHLLYPSPVLIEFIPSILTLTLNGIDANDAKKTALTLSLLDALFTHLPIKSNYTSGFADTADVPQAAATLYGPSYLELVQQEDSVLGDSFVSLSLSLSAEVKWTAYRNALSGLGSAVLDWAVQFIEKVFGLLEGKENIREGKKAEYNLGPHVAEAMDIFFGALDADCAVVISEVVWKKVKLITNLSAGKEWAKLLDAMVSVHPATLAPRAIATLLGNHDDDSLVSFSTEKLAFHLKLLSGVVRRIGGELMQQYLPRVRRFLSDEYTHHSDKAVRKASAKLLRDVLRCLTSFYTPELPPALGGGDLLGPVSYQTPFGAPRDLTNIKLHWHVPTTSSATVAITLLKETVSQSMGTIEALVSAAATAGVREQDGLPFKKLEELLLNHLQVVRKGLRGSAELLGDKLRGKERDGAEEEMAMETDPESLSSELEKVSMDVEGDGDEEGGDEGKGGEDGPREVLSTGREAVLGLLSEEDRAYLQDLRHHTASFLSRLYQLLRDPSFSGNAYSGIRNSTNIYKLWMKIYSDIVTRRGCWYRRVGMYLQGYTMYKRSNRSHIVRTMQRASKLFNKQSVTSFSESVVVGAGAGADPSRGLVVWWKLLQQSGFWYSHDIGNHNVVDKTRLMLATRLRELSYVAFKSKGVDVAPYLRCLEHTAELCGHEYDSIRHIAQKQFNEVSDRFGWHLINIFRPLVKALCTPGTTYFQASGALRMINEKRILHRVTGQWRLTASFLEMVVSRSAEMVRAIPEADRQKKLMDQISEVFGNYINHWQQTPIPSHSLSSSFHTTSAADPRASHRKHPTEYLAYLLLGNSVATISGPSLESGGVGNISPDVMNTDSSVTGSATGAVRLALRHDMFSSFTLLHLIGAWNQVSNVPPQLWTQTLDRICDSQHSPVQHIYVSILTKLAYMLVATPNAVILDSGRISNSPSSTVDKSYIQSVIRTHATSLFHATLSDMHRKAGEDAQWSKGIEEMLRAAEYIRGVLPRSVCSRVSDRELFESSFQRDHASLYMSIFIILSDLSSTSEYPVAEAAVHHSGNTVEVINSLLAATESLPETNEGERKANDATRAELFCGILLGLAHSRQELSALTERPRDIAEAWSRLALYLTDNIQKLSFSSTGVWAEALCLGLSGVASRPTDAIPAMLLEQVDRAVRVGGDGGQLTLSDEGFSRQAKALLLTRALLRADLAVCVKDKSPTVSAIARSLFAILCDPSAQLVSPYRANRDEVVAILTCLTDSHSLSSSSGDMQLLVELANRLERQVSERRNTSTVPTSGADPSQTLVASTGISMELVEAVEPLAVVVSTNGAAPTETVTTEADSGKLLFEFGARWLEHVVHYLPFARSHPVIFPLLRISLEGSGHTDIEVAKICHRVSLVAVQSLHMLQPARDLNGRIVDLLAESYDRFASLHVRETVLMCVTAFYTSVYSALSVADKKKCRDVLTEGLVDTARPELQTLSRVGMASYLITKPLSELQSLAEAYIKNSDVLAARERKKRKLNKESAGTETGTSAATSTSGDKEKPDRLYLTTVMMMSCLLMAFPYDLPSFAPTLLASFVKHFHVHAVKTTVTKTIQDFKSMHQDRWTDFKLKFSKDQLDDLEGAGAAHYFS